MEVPAWHRWAWLAAAAVLVGAVVFLQQFTLGLRGMTLSSVPREVAEREEPEDPGISEFTLHAKTIVRLSGRRDVDGPGLEELDAAALSRVDRLRAAIVAGEVVGPEEALRRLDGLAAEATPGGAMALEIAWLKRLYESGPSAVPDDARGALLDRHGWFAEVALSRGMHPGERARASVVGGGSRLVATMTAVTIGMFLALAAGVLALLVLVGMWRHGGLIGHFNEAVGGPVYLEMFAVFTGGFLLVLGAVLIAFGASMEATAGALVVHEVVTWLLVGTLAWPLIRGVPWYRFAWDVGLHRGEGFFKEVWCGFLGWLVSIPISAGLGLIVSLVESSGETEPGSGPQGYPLFEPPPSGTWGLLWLDTLSLIVWAPVVEEVVYRGALYRYFRPWIRPWGAAVATSALFGLVHPYTTAGLVQVAILGLVLAALREWRGSLIAPITCHFLHNASIALVTIAIVAAID